MAESAAKSLTPDSLSAAANAALAGKEALAGTRAAGNAIRASSGRATLPLVAGGSLLAGLSGGLAVMRRRRHR
jgi:hypothetical protein